MRLSTTILLAALVSALSVYAVDCPPAVTPMQMMQCCKTMPCSHGKNCCQVKSTSHLPFINAAAGRLNSPSATRAVIVSISQNRAAAEAFFSFAVARSHAPPGLASRVTSLPLRI